MAGYVRNDTSNNIATGNIINASDLDGEFDAIQAAFVNSTGHTHDGTTAEGAPITKVGPTQDISVSAIAATPKITNTVDLGSSTLRFKDLYAATGQFRGANAVRSEAASTQDAMVLAGRAGGTSSFAVTLTPTTLTASRTVTFPDSNTTIPIASQVITFSGPTTARTYTLPDSASTLAALGTAQTFTAAQTFRAASAVRSEAASTQDAVVLAGRAGGTSSFAVTLTPTTLAANRTITLPDATTTMVGTDVTQTLSAKTITGLRETRVAMGANDVDISAGNYFTKTISGTTTFTVSNVPTSGTAASFILDLTNGGSATINWWSGVKWASGTAPTLTAAGRDVLGFFTHDGGTTWTGLLLAKDAK